MGKTFGFKADPGMADRINEYREANGLSKSDFLKEAVSSYLAGSPGVSNTNGNRHPDKANAEPPGEPGGSDSIRDTPDPDADWFPDPEDPTKYNTNPKPSGDPPEEPSGSWIRTAAGVAVAILLGMVAGGRR